MPVESNPYAAVIADLKARRDDIDRIIADLERFAAGTSGSGAVVAQHVEQIRPDTFFGHTIPEAAKKYLGMTGRQTRSVEQIADSLLKGGMETNARDFVGTVKAMLRRYEERDGEVIRVGGEWGLAEWYPNRPRRRRPSRDAAESPAEEMIEDVERQQDMTPADLGLPGDVFLSRTK